MERRDGSHPKGYKLAPRRITTMDRGSIFDVKANTLYDIEGDGSWRKLTHARIELHKLTKNDRKTKLFRN